MEKYIEVINGQEVTVTVCQPATQSPREARQQRLTSPRAYRTQKERDAKLAKRGLRQSAISDAYSLASQFGVEQETISESEFLWKMARAPQKRPLRHQNNIVASTRLGDYDL